MGEESALRGETPILQRKTEYIESNPLLWDEDNENLINLGNNPARGGESVPDKYGK